MVRLHDNELSAVDLMPNRQAHSATHNSFGSYAVLVLAQAYALTKCIAWHAGV